MSVEIFLLGMQAAGAIGDFVGTQAQMEVGRLGHEVDMAQLNTRLEEEQLAASQAALSGMQQLRQTLSYQHAVLAARGQAGTGSAGFAAQHAIDTQARDARLQRMNLLSREAQLRAHGALSGMHQLSSETQLGQAMSRRMFEQLPFSEAAQNLARQRGFGIE